MTFVCFLIWFSQLVSWSVNWSVGHSVSRMVDQSLDWPVDCSFVFVRSLVRFFLRLVCGSVGFSFVRPFSRLSVPLLVHLFSLFVHLLIPFSTYC